MDDRAIGLQEVAFLLGFSDQSAFHRAFVRWTGKRPGQYRAGA
jgi:AraC-like DNA-binding protein